MPLFICFMPDLPDALPRRLAVRAEHQAMGREAKARGENVFGRAFLSDTGDLAGSCRLIRYESLDAAWDAIKRDPYWINDVWDKDRLQVRSLDPAAGDDILSLGA